MVDSNVSTLVVIVSTVLDIENTELRGVDAVSEVSYDDCCEVDELSDVISVESVNEFVVSLATWSVELPVIIVMLLSIEEVTVVSKALYVSVDAICVEPVGSDVPSILKNQQIKLWKFFSKENAIKRAPLSFF